jgi:hypothetical protein
MIINILQKNNSQIVVLQKFYHFFHCYFDCAFSKLGQESATLNLQHGTFIFNINFFQNGALGRQKGGPALARAWKHLFALIFCFFGIYIERSRNI